jgi:hypothetical protein
MTAKRFGMKGSLYSAISALMIIGQALAQESSKDSPAKTEVVIVGTIHQAHFQNPNYNVERLKEILVSLKPSAILNELPLELVEPDGRPKAREKDKQPECWATDTVANELGILQIPFDRPDRQENFRKTRYFEREDQSNSRFKQWGLKLFKETPESPDLKIALLLDEAERAESHLFRKGSAEMINSEAHDAIIRIKKSLMESIIPEILKKYSDYESLVEDANFFRSEWQQRNRIMADNILKAAREYSGRRLAVVTGATHRYILRDLLKDEKSIVLKEFWEVIDPVAVRSEITKGDKADLISPEQLKEDLDFLFKTIEDVHPNMYAYISQEEFLKHKEQLYREINRPMNPMEFYKLVAPVVAQLRNGHTFMQPPSKEFQQHLQNGGKIFIVSLYCYDNMVIVKKSQDAEGLPVGSIIEKINGQDALAVLQRLAGYFPAEGKTYNLSLLEDGRLPGFLYVEYGDPPFLTLQIRRPDGTSGEYPLKPITLAEYKSKNQNQEGKSNYRYYNFSDFKTAVIEFNIFSDMEKFKVFLQETFTKIKQENIPNLIIDIRNNPGGNSSLGDELLKYLTDKPFKQIENGEIKLSRQLYEKSMLSREDYAGAEPGSVVSMGEISDIKPGENPLRFSGKVYVLISLITASSSVMFASTVKHYDIGPLIGQETIDTPVNYGDCFMDELPHSRLTFSVAHKYFVCAGGKADGRGVLPDYEVQQKPEDTAKGVDTVMQFALELIKKQWGE